MASSLLDDKIVVVTGGAGLLGQVFVRAIVEQGGTAVIADINADAGQAAVAQLSSALGTDRIGYHPLDITSKESVQRLLQNTSARYGKIDALVNNAYPRNANYGRRFENVEFDDFCDNVRLQLGGYFLTAQQFALFFREQGHGNIITMSSIYGVVAPRFDIYENSTTTMPVEYAAIKSAVIHLNQYMMRYFKGHDIRFNCLSPGGIFDNHRETFVQAYGKYAQTKGMLAPNDLAGTLVFLLSDLSRYVNGQNIVVDDGWSV